MLSELVQVRVCSIRQTPTQLFGIAVPVHDVSTHIRRRRAFSKMPISINGDGVVSQTTLAGVEITVPISVYGIFLLTMGMVLVADWCSRSLTHEFLWGEFFIMLLMISSVVWMVWVMVKTKLAVRRAAGISPNVPAPKPFERGAKSHVEPGTNLLVKALIGFSAFSLLLVSFQTADAVVAPNSCSSQVAVVSCLCKFVYILVQVCYIVYSRSRVLFKKSVVHGAAVMQMIVANIILYSWTFVKSKEGILSHGSKTKREYYNMTNVIVVDNNSGVTNNSTHTLDVAECLGTTYKTVFPWLYPFCLEFCLTASAMMAEQWLNLPSPPTDPRGEDDSAMQLSVSVEEHRPERQENCNHDRTKPSKVWATAVGMFTFVAHIGVIAFLMIEEKPELASNAWYASKTGAAIFIIVLSAYGLYTLGRCNRGSVSEGLHLDEVLLLIASVGVLALSLFRGFPAAAKLVDGPEKEVSRALLVFFTEIPVVVGIITQTTFISKALHREPGEHGLTTASIAIVMGWLNFGWWLSSTVHIEGMDNPIYKNGTTTTIDELQTERFGDSSWLVFFLLCFPVVIFYRIHSAVVLYRISKEHSHATANEGTELSAIVDIERNMKSMSDRWAYLKREMDKVSHRWNQFYQQNNPTVQQRLHQLSQQVEEFNQTVRTSTS